MEYVGNNNKYRLADIIEDHIEPLKDHIDQHSKSLRTSIKTTLNKIVACRKKKLGYSMYYCDNCDKRHVIKHSCKSRFCSSCGKKATDKWIKESVDKLPDTLWQHITFTIPDIYWPLFWYNRNLMIIVPKISVNILTDIAKKKKVNIGILLAIHTFGRDLKRNYHLHLSVTVKGLSLNGNYLKKIYFYHDVVKKKWRYEITKLLKSLYKSKELELPKSYDHFEMILDNYFQKQWVVYFNKSDENNIRNIEYFGKYVKRPPLGETSIKYYDRSNVKFEYLDHKDKKKKIMTLSGLDFVKRLIYHIPDKYFRSIRYYGILANRNKKEKLQIINNLLLEEKIVNDNVKNDKDLKRQELKEKKIEKLRNTKTDYRSLYKRAFNKDPLFCDNCNIEMKLAYRCYISLENLRKRKSLKMLGKKC